MNVALGRLRAGVAAPAGGMWLFAAVFSAQFGHLLEHIAKTVTGAGLLGMSFDSELSHLTFNGAIALLSLLLVVAYSGNPWVYPLMLISLLHGAEHIYIFNQYIGTGLSDGPGLFGAGGAIGAFPLARIDLHNIYNGTEVVLLTMGLSHELNTRLEVEE